MLDRTSTKEPTDQPRDLAQTPDVFHLDRGALLTEADFLHLTADLYDITIIIVLDVADEGIELAVMAPQCRGPGVCPASDFVPMIASHMMAAMLRRKQFRLLSHDLSPQRDLPGLLNNYNLRFAVS